MPTRVALGAFARPLNSDVMRRIQVGAGFEVNAMVVAIFRARIRPECADEYYRHAESMSQIATSMPGFVSYKAFTAPDGERVSIHEWRTAEELRAWRLHPQHVVMQGIGRERFYEEYTLYVMDGPRESRFTRERTAVAGA